jgi:hypothetical protein
MAQLRMANERVELSEFDWSCLSLRRCKRVAESGGRAAGGGDSKESMLEFSVFRGGSSDEFR